MNKKVVPIPKDHALRFIHTIGHELKQPLSLIRAYTFYIKKYLPNDSESQQYPEKINRQVDLLTKMLDDIVETTRLSIEQIELRQEKIDLVSQIKNIIDDIESAYPTQKISFATTQPKATVIGDRMRLRQVFVNLLTNAIKFSGKNDPVSVQVKSSSKKVTIIIKDKGVGFPEEETAHIFEPYYRIMGNGKKVKGLGLGLSLVKQVVELHQGEIKVSSQVGQGSQFSVTLPSANKK